MVEDIPLIYDPAWVPEGAPEPETPGLDGCSGPAHLLDLN